MTRENFQNSLQAFARRRPFVPFVVELLSGEQFIVEHPEALAMRAGVAIYINTEGKYSLFDHSAVSRLMDIAESFPATSP
jgi:hypothetical protein